MHSTAATPEEYIVSLPDDRKHAVSEIRKAILKNLPKGFEEKMGYGMLGYVVPHSLYSKGYHCDPKTPLPFLGLASQKNYISFYHMGLYAGVMLDWFQEQWKIVSPKKLDMGKCCVRFKKFEDVPLGLIGELCTKMTPQQWIDIYESHLKR
jgi:hypothetical protein